MALGQPAHRGQRSTTSPPSRARATATTARAPRSSCCSPARLSKEVEVAGRIHSRFSQNYWTNFGGFGGRNPARDPPVDCNGGDCGEFDPRSQPVRQAARHDRDAHPGLQAGSTRRPSAPTTSACSTRSSSARSATSTATTPRACCFQGSRHGASVDLGRGAHLAAAAVGRPRLQHRRLPRRGRRLRLADASTRPIDSSTSAPSASTPTTSRSTPRTRNLDDGRDLETRFENDGLRRQGSASTRARTFDIRGAGYYSTATPNPNARRRTQLFGISGFSPVPAGKLGRQRLQAERRPQRPVRHRPVVQRRVLRHRRRVRVDPGGAPRVRRAAHRRSRRRLRLPRPRQRGLRRLRAATRRASATAAGTATRSRWPRSTSTTSSPTSTSRWPRR